MQQWVGVRRLDLQHNAAEPWPRGRGRLTGGVIALSCLLFAANGREIDRTTQFGCAFA